ncbi:MAG: hypothetical protein HQK63_00110 [Desulfamplus sp.]|nr:hypothetical protein [Desulfamplus sp.]
MKSEKHVFKFMLKLWFIVITAIATGFYTQQITLRDVERYLGGFNIAFYFFVSVYALTVFLYHIRKKMPSSCLAAVLFGAFISGSMGVLDIVWYRLEAEQVLLTWLNMLWSFLELSYAVYIALTIYIINNYQIRFDKECKNDFLDEILSEK